MILVYKHLKNVSDFSKVVLHIHHKGILGSQSPIRLSDNCFGCEWCIVHFVENHLKFEMAIVDTP
jgi:hypothetical protein